MLRLKPDAAGELRENRNVPPLRFEQYNVQQNSDPYYDKANIVPVIHNIDL